MDSLAEYWVNIPAVSLPTSRSSICFSAMTDKLKQLVAILDVVGIEKHSSGAVPKVVWPPLHRSTRHSPCFCWREAVYNVPTTAALIGVAAVKSWIAAVVRLRYREVGSERGRTFSSRSFQRL